MNKIDAHISFLSTLFDSPKQSLSAVNLILYELNHQFQGFASSDRVQYWEDVRKELLKLMQ